MKKHVLFGCCLFLAAGLVAQSIPNGTFENWSTVNWSDPTGYNTANDQGVPMGAPANVTQTAGYHGSFGVQLKTINPGGGSEGGFFINANVGNGKGITGGIPYAQKPTGIRFYYKYAPAGTDTAAVLVMFKKSGAIIDSFLITLPKTVSSYTLGSYKPKNPLALTPDTVIFGAISSMSILRNGGGIAGSTFVIDSVTFTGVTSQPANMNGDFENWTADSFQYPTGWYASYPNAVQTTDKQSGSYALQLTTSNAGGKIQPGNASTGYYPNCHGNCNEKGGYPYTLTKDTLEFGFKYAPMKGDTAQINLSFIKGGMSVFYAGLYITSTATTYRDTIVPFDNPGTTPDTVIVTLQSSYHNHDTDNTQYAKFIGSVLKIDNLTFASQKNKLGIVNYSDNSLVKIYPVPAKDRVHVDLSSVSGSIEKLALFDLSGKLVGSVVYSEGNRNTLATMETGNLAAGVYLMEVTTATAKYYQKVCKE